MTLALRSVSLPTSLSFRSTSEEAIMAKSNGPATRKMVGSGKSTKTQVTGGAAGVADGPSRSSGGTKVHSTLNPDGKEVTWATANVGSFQLQAAGQSLHPVSGLPQYAAGKDLDFTNGPIELDEETLEMVEKVLAGEHTDRTISGHRFREIATAAGLAIVHQGLELPPMPSWDKTSDDRVVPVAYEAGALSSLGAVNIAERYERQSVKRTPKREPRAKVLADLAAVRAKYDADAVVPGAELDTSTSGEISTPTVEL